MEKRLGTLALSTALCAAFATQAVADDGRAVEIEVRPDGPTRQVKPVNGVGQPPMIGAPRSFPMMHYLKDAGIPFSRLHDVGGAYGRMTYVDIPNLFRDFDADETKPENYDFAFTDRLVSALVDSGIEPIFRLGVTIENYADIRAYRIAPPKDFAKWARICEHVILHYNEGWADGFRHGIRYWEIWNEPDNMPEPEKNTMWSGSFEDFMRLYGTAATHLKKKFPHLKIGGYGSCGFYAPVGAGTVRAANASPRAEHFVDCCTNFLARARDEGWPLDFFSFHSYSRPEHAVRQVEVARRVLNEYGFAATETCFDEWLPEPQKFRCGTALAASKIAAEIIGLQNSSCDMAMIYDARCGVGDYSPLFNPMTQKPHKAYYAFVAFNELRKAGLAVPCMVSDDRIWACAAKGGDGKVRVMLSNPCDEAVEIKLKGLSGVLSCMLTDESRTYERVPFSPRLPPRSFVLMETPAADIQARIDAAAERGGGRVVVQKGVHRCGTLRLRSGVELHLEEGAVLMGGSKPDDYEDVIPEEMVYRYGNANTSPTVTRKAFIIAEDAENIAITGKGTVHIDGPRFFDQGSSLWGYWWAKPPCPRPRAVVMYRCRNIRIEGVTFRDCPLWTMWLRLCDGITIDGITIDAEQKMINSDGIDFDGCRHVRVGNSRLKTGDDCLVLRSIRYGHPGEKSVVTEDVVVSNCVLNSFCQGVRIGCPSDDTIRNATFRDIEFTGLNGIVSKQPRVYLNEGCNGYLKTDGILFENWKIDCYGHPVEILVEPGIALRDFGHMTFRNIEVNARKPFVVRGNEPTPLRGIRFENVRGTVASDKTFDVAFAPDVVFDRVDVSQDGWRRHAAGGFDRPEIMCLVADPFDDRRLLVGTWGNSISVFLL